MKPDNARIWFIIACSAMLGILIAALNGCARFSTVQSDVSVATNGTTRTITTDVTSYTLFSSKLLLAGFKAQQTDKTQGASVGQLSQQGETNMVAIITAISAGVAAGMKAAATGTP